MKYEQPNVLDRRKLIEAVDNITRRNELGEIAALINFVEKTLSFVEQKDIKLIGVERK